jgi:three-Cys-motif partner protein
MEDDLVLADDGIIAPIVGEWGRKKYDLIAYYSKLFANGMRYHWENRVYIDLFSGAGRARLGNDGEFIETSAMLAYQDDCLFTHYIFSDICPKRLGALKERVLKRKQSRTSEFVLGDSNVNASEIFAKIPQHSRGNKVLSFCVVDPFKIDDLAFSTIQSLSSKAIDFLVLIPTFMDVNRNLAPYLRPSSKHIEKFLGDPDWRMKWDTSHRKMAPSAFGYFVLKQFCEKMKSLGYLDGSTEAKQVNLDWNNVPLYHLAFFSKSKTGMDFWKKAKHGTDPQESLLGLL